MPLSGACDRLDFRRARRETFPTRRERHSGRRSPPPLGENALRARTALSGGRTERHPRIRQCRTPFDAVLFHREPCRTGVRWPSAPMPTLVARFRRHQSCCQTCRRHPGSTLCELGSEDDRFERFDVRRCEVTSLSSRLRVAAVHDEHDTSVWRESRCSTEPNGNRTIRSRIDEPEAASGLASYFRRRVGLLRINRSGCQQ